MRLQGDSSNPPLNQIGDLAKSPICPKSCGCALYYSLLHSLFAVFPVCYYYYYYYYYYYSRSLYMYTYTVEVSTRPGRMRAGPRRARVEYVLTGSPLPGSVLAKRFLNSLAVRAGLSILYGSGHDSIEGSIKKFNIF